LHSLRKALDFVPKTSPHLEWCIRTNLKAWLKEHLTLTESHELPPGEILAIARTGQKIWMHRSSLGKIQCWNKQSGQFETPAWETSFLVRNAKLSPTGDNLAVVTAKTPYVSEIHSLYASTLTPSSKTIIVNNLLATAFTSNGSLVVAKKAPRDKGTSNKDQTKLEWWDANLTEPSGQSLDLPGYLDAMLISSDNRTLISLLESGSVLRLTDLSSLATRHIKLKTPIPEPKLALSDDGRWLLAGGKDRVVTLIDLSTEAPVCLLRHRMPVAYVTFSYDGKRLITGANADALRIWEGIESLGQPSHKENIGRSPSIASTSSGLRLATAMHDGHIRTWDLKAGKLKPVLKFPQDRGNQRLVKFSIDDSRIASSTFTTNGVTVWDAETGAPLTFLDHPSRVRDITFDPTERYIATAGFDDGAWIWKLDGSRHQGPLRHGAGVCKSLFSPDGKVLVTVSEDGAIRHWDVATGRLKGEPIQHGGNRPIRDTDLEPNGQNFATIADSGDAHLWRLEDGSYVGHSFAHGFEPGIVRYSSGGQFLITGGNDHAVRIWHVSTGKSQGRRMQHLAKVTSAKFSPCDRWITTTSDDGTAKFWAADSGRPIGPALQHDGLVKDVISGARHSVTVGLDGTIRVWNSPTPLLGNPSSISRQIERVTGLSSTEDGRFGPLAPKDWNALD
jgi:WD40 repeat protein